MKSKMKKRKKQSKKHHETQRYGKKELVLASVLASAAAQPGDHGSLKLALEALNEANQEAYAHDKQTEQLVEIALHLLLSFFLEASEEEQQPQPQQEEPQQPKDCISPSDVFPSFVSLSEARSLFFSLVREKGLQVSLRAVLRKLLRRVTVRNSLPFREQAEQEGGLVTGALLEAVDAVGSYVGRMMRNRAQMVDEQKQLDDELVDIEQCIAQLKVEINEYEGKIQAGHKHKRVVTAWKKALETRKARLASQQKYLDERRVQVPDEKRRLKEFHDRSVGSLMELVDENYGGLPERQTARAEWLMQTMEVSTKVAVFDGQKDKLVAAVRALAERKMQPDTLQLLCDPDLRANVDTWVDSMVRMHLAMGSAKKSGEQGREDVKFGFNGHVWTKQRWAGVKKSHSTYLANYYSPGELQALLTNNEAVEKGSMAPIFYPLISNTKLNKLKGWQKKKAGTCFLVVGEAPYWACSSIKSGRGTFMQVLKIVGGLLAEHVGAKTFNVLALYDAFFCSLSERQAVEVLLCEECKRHWMGGRRSKLGSSTGRFYSQPVGKMEEAEHWCKTEGEGAVNYEASTHAFNRKRDCRSCSDKYERLLQNQLMPRLVDAINVAKEAAEKVVLLVMGKPPKYVIDKAAEQYADTFDEQVNVFHLAHPDPRERPTLALSQAFWEKWTRDFSLAVSGNAEFVQPLITKLIKTGVALMPPESEEHVALFQSYYDTVLKVQTAVQQQCEGVSLPVRVATKDFTSEADLMGLVAVLRNKLSPLFGKSEEREELERKKVERMEAKPTSFNDLVHAQVGLLLKRVKETMRGGDNALCSRCKSRVSAMFDERSEIDKYYRGVLGEQGERVTVNPLDGLREMWTACRESSNGCMGEQRAAAIDDLEVLEDLEFLRSENRVAAILAEHKATLEEHSTVVKSEKKRAKKLGGTEVKERLAAKNAELWGQIYADPTHEVPAELKRQRKIVLMLRAGHNVQQIREALARAVDAPMEVAMELEDEGAGEEEQQPEPMDEGSEEEDTNVTIKVVAGARSDNVDVRQRQVVADFVIAEGARGPMLYDMLEERVGRAYIYRDLERNYEIKRDSKAPMRTDRCTQYIVLEKYEPSTIPTLLLAPTYSLTPSFFRRETCALLAIWGRFIQKFKEKLAASGQEGMLVTLMGNIMQLVPESLRVPPPFAAETVMRCTSFAAVDPNHLVIGDGDKPQQHKWLLNLARLLMPCSGKRQHTLKKRDKVPGRNIFYMTDGVQYHQVEEKIGGISPKQEYDKFDRERMANSRERNAQEVMSAQEDVKEGVCSLDPGFDSLAAVMAWDMEEALTNAITSQEADPEPINLKDALAGRLNISRGQLDNELRTAHYSAVKKKGLQETRATLAQAVAKENVKQHPLAHLLKPERLDGGLVSLKRCTLSEQRQVLLEHLVLLAPRLRLYGDRVYPEEKLHRHRTLDQFASRFVHWAVLHGQHACGLRTAKPANRLPPKRRRRRAHGNSHWDAHAVKERDKNTPLAVIRIYYGDWHGRQPARRMKRNHFPRIEFRRRLQRAVHAYIKSNAHQRTRIVLQFDVVSEYRTSKQCPSLHHHVASDPKEARVTRVAPPADLVHTPNCWKLRYCPSCGVITHRDTSAAFNIAVRSEWNRLYRKGGNFTQLLERRNLGAFPTGMDPQHASQHIQDLLNPEH